MLAIVFYAKNTKFFTKDAEGFLRTEKITEKNKISRLTLARGFGIFLLLFRER